MTFHAFDPGVCPSLGHSVHYTSVTALYVTNSSSNDKVM